MITFKIKGDYKRTERYFKRLTQKKYLQILDKYGKQGVEALAAATPKDTGRTADSWRYEIETGPNSSSIIFVNDNINKYVNIAVILQYGHATRNGGWVEGRDYINPAVQPLFDEMVKKAWEEVIRV